MLSSSTIGVVSSTILETSQVVRTECFSLEVHMKSYKLRGDESLCEKSMKVVTSMVRLSSLSICKVSLGTSKPLPVIRNLASVAAPVVVVEKQPLPQITGNRRSQEPQISGKKRRVFLVEAVAENGCSSIVREDNSIDGKASDYINKVHAKIRGASNDTANPSAYIIPPPPRTCS